METSRTPQAASPPEPAPSVTMVLWVLAGTSALCFATIGCYASVLPGFITQDLGGGPSTVGLVMGATAVVAVVLRPMAGAIGDRRGRRSTAVWGGVALAAAPLLLVGLDAIPVLIAARILVGVGDALSNTAAMAWAVDVAPPERRGRAMATIGMSIWLGLALGPQWGVAMRDAFGYDGVWLGAAALGLGAGALPLLLPAPAPRPTEPHGAPTERLPRGALLAGLAMALTCYGAGVYEAFGILHLVGRGVRDGAGLGGAASTFTIIAVSSFAFRFAGGALSDRLGPRPVALAAVACVVVADISLARADSFGSAALGSIVLGAAMALVYPSLGLITTLTVPVASRGRGIGVFTASLDVTFGLGAVLGGVVVAATSTEFALASAALVALLAVPLVATIRIPESIDDAVVPDRSLTPASPQ